MLNLKNFILFIYNYNHNFIEEIWGGNEMMVMHLKGKWNQYSEYNTNSTALMMKFLSELDTERQQDVEKHIKDNPKRYA